MLSLAGKCGRATCEIVGVGHLEQSMTIYFKLALTGLVALGDRKSMVDTTYIKRMVEPYVRVELGREFGINFSSQV